MYGSDQCRSASIVTVAPPSEVRELLLDPLRDAGRLDPVCDLGEQAQLEPVGGLLASRLDRDALPDLILRQPRRLDIVLVEDDGLAGALLADEADGEKPARPGLVGPGDLLDNGLGAFRAGDADDLPCPEARLHRAQRNAG